MSYNRKLQRYFGCKAANTKHVFFLTFEQESTFLIEGFFLG